MLSLLVIMLAAAPLDAAEQRFRDLRYAETLTELSRVSGALDEATFVRRLELTAISRAMTQKSDAVDAFRTLLWLRPEWTLPPEFGPRVRTPFLEAKATKTVGPAVLVEANGVTLPEDPLRLIANVELEWTQRDAVRSERYKYAPKLTAPWKADEDTKVVTRLLAADGSTLFQSAPVELKLAPVKVEAPPPVIVPPEPAQKPKLAAPIIATVAAVALLGTGAGLHGHAAANEGRLEQTMRNSDGAITDITQREAARLDGAIRNERLAGTLSLIGGAAVTAAAVVLWVQALNTEVRAGPNGVSLRIPIDADFQPSRRAR